MLVRVDFSPQDFEDIIQAKGYRILWEKAMNCPCIDSATLRVVADCNQCDGRGKFFYQSENIKGIITRQNKELQIGDAIGILEPGSAYLTVSHNKFVSQFDRITNLDSSALYTETLFHSDKQGDWLRYVPVGNVVAALTQPTRTSPVITLQQNQDYKLQGNQLIWLSGTNKPKDKQGISVRYNYNPVWLVTNVINYVRDTFVQFGNPTDTFTPMPVRVEMRLEYLGSGVTT
jgi:hypothetical protein